jgi:hypothetical protein
MTGTKQVKGTEPMANARFDRPIIASYTEIAALLCVIWDGSPASIMLGYQLYGNLCWERKSNVLYLCGKYDHFSYREFEEEGIVLLHKLPKKTTRDEVMRWIDQGFYTLMPINTKHLGITEHPFKHNVFLAGHEGDAFTVYDFWPPSFTWKGRQMDGYALFESVDFTNPDTVQSFYLFKKNEAFSSTIHPRVDFDELRTSLSSYWVREPSEAYDVGRSAYGPCAYSALCEYLALAQTLSLTDCQNMHVLYDHLTFTRHCLSALFADHPSVQRVLSLYADLVSHANKLRTFAYKHYIAQKEMDGARALMVDQIHAIGENERTAISHMFGQ